MSSVPYQPVSTLPGEVRVCFSTVADGSLAAGGGNHPTPEHHHNARVFLEQHHFSIPSVRLFVTYGDSHTYTEVRRVGTDERGQEVAADALYTTDPEVTLTLPVADCVATVVYDPVAGLLGVLHLGRHASVSGLIEAFAASVSAQAGSRPENWHVWMSPSLQAASNRLEYFNPLHLQEWEAFTRHDDDGMLRVDIPAHNKERFMLLGVPEGSMYVSSVDTYTDAHYFSYRAAVERNDPSRQGRMAVAAMMTGPGKTAR